jgi:cell division protein ZapE
VTHPRIPGANSPLEVYSALLDRGDIQEDSHQRVVIAELDRLWRELESRPQAGLLQRLKKKPRKAVRGLYLWGSVGRGKTWLMDLFLGTLQTQRASRIHFHRFMARVHDDLARHEARRDPLKHAARSWAKRCDVLCFDEFFVSDIADAMLLGGLLTALFEENVVLVTTSNVHPDDLYRDGLQRARFLPAIESIKHHCRVVELDGERDHRLRLLESAGVYHLSSTPGSEARMEERFEQFSGGEDLDHDFLINGRRFRARRRGLDVVWLDFAELCEKPRSARDYIEIARDFNTILVSGLPQLGDAQSDAARRFITLVDELYDRNVKLILSAAKEIDEIYRGERLAFEFQRTRSRLIEMQSHDYLARPHLP